MSEEECVCNICSNIFNNTLFNNNDNNNYKKHHYNLRSNSGLILNNMNNINDMNDINDTNNLGHKVQLNCGHLFHYKCIKQWYIKIKNNKCRIGMGRYNERQCPYCRSYGGYLVIPDYDDDFVVGVNIKGIS